MIIVTSEYIFKNPKLNEIKHIINNTIVEHNRKYGENYCRKIEFKYIIQFSDKIKNKTKNIMINRGVKRTIIASQGRYDYVKVNKF